MSESLVLTGNGEKLTDTQKEFMDLVEEFSFKPTYLDPSFRAKLSYPVERNDTLPGDNIRFGLSVDESEDVSERKYYVEFLDTSLAGEPKVVGRVQHKVTETRSQQDVIRTQSAEYKITGFGRDDESLTQEEMERQVQEIMRDIRNAKLAILR